MYNEGISHSLIDLGVEHKLPKRRALDLIQRRDDRQGREAAKQHVMENPDLADELTQPSWIKCTQGRRILDRQRRRSREQGVGSSQSPVR